MAMFICVKVHNCDRIMFKASASAVAFFFLRETYNRYNERKVNFMFNIIAIVGGLICLPVMEFVEGKALEHSNRNK